MAFVEFLPCCFGVEIKRKGIINQKGCSNPILTLALVRFHPFDISDTAQDGNDTQPDMPYNCAVQLHVRDYGSRTWDCTTCTTSIFTITSGVLRIGTHNSYSWNGAFRGGSSVELRILPGGTLGTGVNTLHMRARTLATHFGCKLACARFCPMQCL